MSKWPKRLPTLTAEQKRIKDDWMMHWLTILPNRYRAIEQFNHGYPAKHARPGRVLEIGAGIGEHIRYEKLDDVDYYALELRPEIAQEIQRRHPAVRVTVANCEQSIPFSDGFFDRVIAIHMLEHLPNLPAALREIYRTLKPDGTLSVVIPCEGGLAYSFARMISSKRMFEKRYKMSYDFCIRSEHVNAPREIIEELAALFETRDRSFFPLKAPFVTINLAIGLLLTPRAPVSR